jgi:hypothetical protein
MTDPEHCPLCPRIINGGRPLCNNHMRKAGAPLLDKYFANKRAAALHPGAKVYRDRVDTVVAAMIANAREYERVRDAGLMPVWMKDRQQWSDPRAYARDILTAWTAKHRFGLDTANDADVIERIAAELFPIDEGRRIR